MASGSKATVEELLESKFGNIPTPILSAIEYREYSNEEFKKMEMYSFKSDNIMTEQQLHAAGHMLKESLINGFSDSKDSVALLFMLALNLRNPEDPSSLILSEPKWKEASAKKPFDLFSGNFSYSSVKQFEEKEPVRKTDEELNREAELSFKMPNTEGLSQQEATEKTAESKLIHMEAYRSQYAFNFGKEMGAYKKAQKEASVPDSGASAYYWPFVAAYLMKIFIKAPENVLLGMNNMKDRFITFYPGGVVGETQSSADSMIQLSLKVRAHKTMLNTWIAFTSEYESSKDSTSQGAGLIRYLANIQFGFNGMHGYGLFREVLLATRWRPGQAIMKMWMDPTSDALETIGHIITQYESTIKPDGTPEKKPSYFKYARVVDPRFFLPLQPSQCLSLLYLCCKILNHYISRTELTDPLRMFALSKLGEEQKNFLDTFAEIVLSDEQTDMGKKTKIEQAALIKHREKKEELEALKAEDAVSGNLISEMREKMRKARI
ncbi:TPA_asm: N [Zanthoxylum betacytorhabdovirus 2]|nr:TPA_asm: N [Zanthoxilum betacytorhabdovirus 2]